MNGIIVKTKSKNHIGTLVFLILLVYLYVIRDLSVLYRMKEFERERRLLKREQRKKAKTDSESLQSE